MSPERYESCPDCAARVRVEYSDRLGRDVHFCHACWKRQEEERARIVRLVTAELPALATPFGQRIVRPFVRRYGAAALAHLRSVTDADLLAMPSFGPRMLAHLRQAVPTPAPVVPASVPELDVAAYAAEVG